MNFTVDLIDRCSRGQGLFTRMINTTITRSNFYKFIESKQTSTIFIVTQQDTTGHLDLLQYHVMHINTEHVNEQNRIEYFISFDQSDLVFGHIARRPHRGFGTLDPKYRDIMELHCTISISILK